MPEAPPRRWLMWSLAAGAIVVGAVAGTLAQAAPIGVAFGLAGGLTAGLALGLALRRRSAGPRRDADSPPGEPAPPSPGHTAPALLDGVPTPVLGVDRRGVVLAANDAAVVFLAGRAGGIVGRPLEDLFTQADIFVHLAAAVEGRDSRGEVRVPVGEGYRTYEVTARPAAAGGLAAVLTLRDVTELAAAVQLKTDFVANASHELRTPLASIRAAADTLAAGAWNDPAMRDRFIGMIAANAARLEEMVRDFLDLSRLEAPDVPVRLARVSTADLAQGLRDAFEQAAAERHVHLVFEFDNRLEHLRTDARLLNLVLKNLVENAVKFAYEGTEVRMVGEVVDAEGVAAARFRVIDRGVGIPIALQGRIFERFFQVDPARTGTAQRRGTGLGLAIAKHAAKALGATLGVESVWKEGTTMTLVLPGAVEAPSPGSP